MNTHESAAKESTSAEGSGSPSRRFSFRLFPREERFFEMFVEDGANVLVAARKLNEMLRTYDDIDRRADELRSLEHRGDELSRDIWEKLNTSFVTPVDREDIVALIGALDDVLDLIDETADTFALYRIEAPSRAAVDLSEIIVKQCEVIQEALARLHTFKDLDATSVEIHRLEKEGDQVTRDAVAHLFSDDLDAIQVIKWKDAYNLLEACTDRCDDVAKIIERIVVKHA